MERRYCRGLGVILILLAVCSCSSPPSPITVLPATQTLPLESFMASLIPGTRVQSTSPSATLVATATSILVEPSTTPSPALVPTHRIGVRIIEGVSEFYDRLTGEKFIPRGFNYVRVAPMSAANPELWHSTLNPGYYDSRNAEAALKAMHAMGYNVVRVFIDCCREGNNVGAPAGGISISYLKNVLDFLNLAQENSIFVLLVLDLTPAQGGYDDMWQRCCTSFDGENLRYLTSSGHNGERRFNQDFIHALIDHGAPMDAIFAYDLTNEVHFSVDKPPLSSNSGQVTTANFKTYDMGVPADKQLMMDENLVYWIDQQRAAILKVAPSALVTVSFPAMNTGQTTVNPSSALWSSSADFIDLHTYLGWGLGLDDYMGLFGMDKLPDKPVILGEFGAAKRSYPNAAMAANALQAWQVASCEYGFDGWLLWTWDTAEQVDLWNAVSENGEISAALSPRDRPDPCR